jgi:hypothetical protein
MIGCAVATGRCQAGHETKYPVWHSVGSVAFTWIGLVSAIIWHWCRAAFAFCVVNAMVCALYRDDKAPHTLRVMVCCAVAVRIAAWLPVTERGFVHVCGSKGGMHVCKRPSVWRVFCVRQKRPSPNMCRFQRTIVELSPAIAKLKARGARAVIQYLAMP